MKIAFVFLALLVGCGKAEIPTPEIEVVELHKPCTPIVYKYFSYNGYLITHNSKPTWGDSYFVYAAAEGDAEMIFLHGSNSLSSVKAYIDSL